MCSVVTNYAALAETVVCVKIDGKAGDFPSMNYSAQH